MLKTRPNKSNHIAHRVMERINAENITVSPKSKFVIHKMLLATVIGSTLIFAIFFTSIAFRHLAITRLFGANFMLTHFPWFGAGLAFAALCICFALLEHYKVFYKWTLVGMAAVLIVVNLGAGFLVYKGFSQMSMQQILYKAEGDPLEVLAGRVVEVHGQGSIVLLTLRGHRVPVYMSPRTKLPNGGISEGETVYVAGVYKSEMFIARGVLRLGSR